MISFFRAKNGSAHRLSLCKAAMHEVNQMRTLILLAITAGLSSTAAATDFVVNAGGRVPTTATATIGNATFIFTVAGAPTFLDSVKLHLDMVHSWDEDLTITLKKGAISVVLFDQEPGAGPRFDDFDNTILDDAAGTSITGLGTSAPYAGSYRPKNPLSGFNAINPNGDWTLTVVDNSYGDYGWLYKAGDATFETRRAVMAGTFLDIASHIAAAVPPWHDPSDAYATGSSLIGQGGWSGWDNGTSTNATIVGTPNFSPPNSIRITSTSDVVHQFASATSGRYVFKTKWYVSSTSVGDTYFILLNKYVAGTHAFPDWSVQLRARASAGELRSLETNGTLPLVLDAWADIRVEIDLDTNSTLIYYNNQFLTAHPWYQTGGQAAIEAVDLYSDNLSSLSFHDDLALVHGAIDVLPTSFTVFRGALESGTLTSILTSDDIYVVVKNGATALASESPITVIIEGTAPNETAGDFRFREEGHVSITGLRQRLDLYDFDAAQYLEMDSRPAPTIDLIVGINGASPNRFIEDGTKKVRSRVRIKPDGPIFTNTWRLYLDQAYWLIAPNE